MPIPDVLGLGMDLPIPKEVTEEMKWGYAVAAAGLMAVSAFATVDSGLKPGARTTAFQVVDVSGPNKGRQLCYR